MKGPSIIIETDEAVSVDWNNYDLSLEAAAKELSEGRDVVAREFQDYGDEYSMPEVDTLTARDYEGKTIDQIIEMIRGWYESFGRAS
jgi:hypothetical protein